MKKLSVIAMAERKTELMSGLLRLGCVEISEPDPSLLGEKVKELFEPSDSALTEVQEDISDVATTMGALKEYAGIKEGAFVKRESMSVEEFINDERFLGALDTSGEINRTVAEIDRLKSEEGRLRAKIAALSPWDGLDLPLEFRGTEHTKTYKVVCPLGIDKDEVQRELSEIGAYYQELSEDQQQKYGIVICHKEDKQQVVEIMRPYGFGVSTFPDMTGTPRENLLELKAALKKNRVDQKTNMEKIAVEVEETPDLKILSDRLLVESYVQKNQEKLLTNGNVVCFEGWIPAEEEDKVIKFLDEWGAAWETRDPLEEEMGDVPVKLKNNWLTKPLSMVTEMYSLPRYNNVDPNPLMAPFFILFYGIMMADMGYGLLMILIGLIVKKKFAPKGTAGHLFGLMFYCGISTFIMGAITGGFLGDFIPQLCRIINPESTFDLPHLFTPLNDTIVILVGGMALGFVHVITGMVISAVIKYRRKEYMSILWNEVTWWIVFAGLGLMILKVTNIVLYIAIAMVVVGSGWEAKGFGKVTAVFSSIYTNVTGFFGDILSYSRLMALMLAGSVIASVFNTLGSIPGGVVPFVIISLVGNALNFALNLLGCYVHDQRLQCLEFFGKFYEDGGKPFRPIAFDTKYVDIK